MEIFCSTSQREEKISKLSEEILNTALMSSYYFWNKLSGESLAWEKIGRNERAKDWFNGLKCNQDDKMVLYTNLTIWQEISYNQPLPRPIYLTLSSTHLYWLLAVWTPPIVQLRTNIKYWPNAPLLRTNIGSHIWPIVLLRANIWLDIQSRTNIKYMAQCSIRTNIGSKHWSVLVHVLKWDQILD